MSAKHPGDASQLVAEALRLWRACGDALRLGDELKTLASAAAEPRTDMTHLPVEWGDGLRRLCPRTKNDEACGHVRHFCKASLGDAEGQSFFDKLKQNGWPNAVDYGVFVADFRAWWTKQLSEKRSQAAKSKGIKTPPAPKKTKKVLVPKRPR